MAHIQRRGTRPNYRYRVRYVDDTRRERSRTFTLKGDADDFLTSVSHQLLAGTYIDPAAGRITLKAYAETWRVNQAHLRPKSKASLEQGFRVHVYPHIGDRSLSSIRPSDVAAWQRQLLRPVGPLAPATVKRIRGQLSAMFKAAILDRVVNVNPCAGVRAPKVDRVEVVPLTVDQVRTLEANLLLRCQKVSDRARYQAVVPFVAGSGLRYSEAFGLTVDRVDFLRKTVRVDRQLVRRAKGGAPVFGPPKTPKSTRTVPVAEVTILRLAEHLAKYPPGPHGLVFATTTGAAVERDVFGAPWRVAARSVGLADDKGLHQLRHFYASLLIAAGRSVIEVQARLGHESAEETLKTYSHLWPSHEDGTRAAIEAVLGGPSQAVSAAARPS